MIVVSLTEEHIAKGVPGEGCLCPVALAIEDCSHYRGVHVYSEVVCYELGGNRVFEVDLPDEAREFIRSFDDGDPVNPITFKLDEPPDESGDSSC